MIVSIGWFGNLQHVLLDALLVRQRIVALQLVELLELLLGVLRMRRNTQSQPDQRGDNPRSESQHFSLLCFEDFQKPRRVGSWAKSSDLSVWARGPSRLRKREKGTNPFRPRNGVYPLFRVTWRMPSVPATIRSVARPRNSPCSTMPARAPSCAASACGCGDRAERAVENQVALVGAERGAVGRPGAPPRARRIPRGSAPASASRTGSPRWAAPSACRARARACSRRPR